MNEFELIARWFAGRAAPAAPGVTLGIGDDCALLRPRADHELAVSSDMLVAGRHFFDDVDAEALGWKSLAVNLSDLAAMGARPVAFTLALALPAIDAAWLDGFASGLFACASRFGCALVGGDTTRGPLTISITIIGDLPAGSALRRDGARDGDDVWVSGTVGDAAYALDGLRNGATIEASLRRALERPVPAIALGIALRGIATSAIDVSDGLAQDLGHILDASGVGATLDVAALPLSDALASEAEATRRRHALAGGDDYVLCFTAPVAARNAVLDAGTSTSSRVTRIGRIEPTTGLRFFDASGSRVELDTAGFDHFA